MEEDIRKFKKRWLKQLICILLCTVMITRSAEIPEPRKRQIFREGVLPSRGGVIPDGAFTSQRLKHNIHDTLGIEAPDGVLFIARENDVRPGRRDPEDERDILTLTRKNPLGPVDINGVVPPRPQPTTYLLRRPATESLYPSQYPNLYDALSHRVSYAESFGWHFYPTPPQVLFSPLADAIY